MKFHTVLFDLDGTITDSAEGIMNSIRYAIKKAGKEIPDYETLRSFIGPPLYKQFMKVYGVSEAEGKEMLSFYREYYGEKGIFENRVYDGVMEMLRTLKESGICICMATSKPEYYAKIIAEHFGFAEYFHYIGGATMDSSRKTKHDVIEYVIESCGLKDRSGILMVGDRKHDIEGAELSRIPSMGVLYGYGGQDELEQAGAGVIVASPEEAVDFILG